MRLLAATWRVRRIDAQLLRQALAEGPVIAASFHEHQLPLVALHRAMGFSGLTSQSADGDVVAGVMEQLGYGVLRGSSSRGGVKAALTALRTTLAGGGSVGIAVDGPRGPRRVAQPGAVALASLSGRPLVLMVVSARPAWRASSWDRFMVPLPFARVELRYGLLAAPPPGRASRVQGTRVLQGQMAALAAGDAAGHPALSGGPEAGEG